MFDGTINIANANLNIGDEFCQIVYTGANCRHVGGYGNIRYKGIVMTGGNVKAERNKVVGNYYLGGWSMAFDTTIAMPTLALPNMY
ncbi:DUF6453 family protein [Escherichia coli]|uniref:DUF6453 family protein n=1 Tax=Escherichia coli TaxID=562 RepID=UPI00338DBB7B